MSRVFVLDSLPSDLLSKPSVCSFVERAQVRKVLTNLEREKDLTYSVDAMSDSSQGQFLIFSSADEEAHKQWDLGLVA